MAFIRFYRYQQQLIFPTVMQAQNSFYFDAEPIAIMAVSDKEKVIAYLEKIWKQEIKIVDVPENANSGQSVILNRLGVRRWFQFERESTMFILHTDEEFYKINVTAHHKETGLWAHDLIGERKLSLSTPSSKVIDMLLRIIDEDVKEEEHIRAKENEPKPIKLLPPPTK